LTKYADGVDEYESRRMRSSNTYSASEEHISLLEIAIPLLKLDWLKI